MEKLDNNTKSMDELGNEIEKTSKSIDDAGGRFEKFGGILKGVGVAAGAVAGAAAAAAIKIGKEVVAQFGELSRI